MKNATIRQAQLEDVKAVSALNDLAFGSQDEAQIVRQLNRNGDSLASLVAEKDLKIIGHIQFFRVRVDGRDIGAGLGPMSVHPDFQRLGIGKKLIKYGMTYIEGRNLALCFVLGHTDYYKKFGFSPEVAARYKAPWSGPEYMGIELREDAPRYGTLIYPRAFTAIA